MPLTLTCLDAQCSLPHVNVGALKHRNMHLGWEGTRKCYSLPRRINTAGFSKVFPRDLSLCAALNVYLDCFPTKSHLNHARDIERDHVRKYHFCIARKTVDAVKDGN